MFDQLDAVDLKLIDIVDEAIADGRVSLAVQQICAVNNPDQVLYEECLARLTGFDGTVHSACEFIPCLEALGATPLLDQHMLTLILDRLERDSSAVLGCNLSADNFSSEDTWAGVLEQVQTRPQLAQRLVLELAETQALRSLSFSAHVILQFRGLGCRVALDDFGAGFASPRLLQLIDFDIVKIDKTFIHDIRRSVVGSESLSHMVGFASSFAPIVVVEGVETRAQVDTVNRNGILSLLYSAR